MLQFLAYVFDRIIFYRVGLPVMSCQFAVIQHLKTTLELMTGVVLSCNFASS